MRSSTTSDEQFLRQLTGASQHWLALCRSSVGSGSAGALLADGSREARVLIEQSRSSWAETEPAAVLDDPDDLLADEPEPTAANGVANPEYSAARALAALARGLTGAAEIHTACGEFLAHTDRAGLSSVGSLLMGAGTPATADPGRSTEVVLELLRRGESPARGYAVLMVLELGGRRPARLAESRIRVAFSTFLADGHVGEIGTLRLELLADGPSGLHPDPARMHFLHTDAAFTDGLAAAWAVSSLERTGSCVVWSIELDNGAPANGVRGGSLAAALAVALDDLAPRRRRFRSLRPWRIDPNCVVSAGLSGRDLTVVRGYPAKVAAARERRMRVVVAADAYEEAGRQGEERYPGLRPAATVGEAIREARSKVNRRLYATVALVVALAASTVFAGIEAWAAESRLRAERTASQAQMMAAAAAGLQHTDSALAQQLAVAAYRTDDTVDTRSRLLETTALDAPIRVRADPGRLLIASNQTGSLVVTAGSRGVVTLIRVTGAGPEKVAEFDVGYAVSGDIALSPDEKTVAVAGARGLELWDIADPGRISKLADLSDGRVESLGFSPDSRHLAAGLKGDQFTQMGVLRWDVTDRRRPVTETALPLQIAYLEVSYNHDGKSLAAGGHRGGLRVWDVDANTAQPPVLLDRAPQPFEGEWILAVTFAPHADLLAISSQVAGVEIIDRRAGEWESTRLVGAGDNDNRVRGLAFSSDGRRLAGAGSDRSTRVWRLADTSEPMVLRAPVDVDAISFTAADSFVATGAADGYLRLWPTQRPIQRGIPGDYYQNPAISGSIPVLPPHSATGMDWLRRSPGVVLRSVEFSTEALAVTRDGWGNMELVDTSDSVHPQVYSRMSTAISRNAVGSFRISADGRLLAVLLGQSSIGVWDISDPRAPRPYAAASLPMPVSTTTLAFDPRGLLAVGTASGVVHLFDTGRRGTLPQLATLSISDHAAAVAFSGSTGLLAVTGGARIALFDTTDPSVPRDLGVRLTGPSQWDAVRSLAFSPDGSLLASTGSKSGIIQLWRVTDRGNPTVHAVLDSGGGRELGVSFTEDSRFVAVSGFAERSGTLSVWATDPDAAAHSICDSGTATIDDEEWRRYLARIPRTGAC
ncbi:WD40 repeat domain-containing protein [Nocardia caishijiensis]|uniref:WD40 repeat protein n=1 Tax=Nocardia caishijiensis TaxID=184756 RepID=A0ABQ6YMX6_9NOCA|nr:WD40 repeat domain-containing protein [Nocardia caishijiensis]KAF0847071.1 WD40 repeat protein [Nocardia caishijiensis]